MALGHRCEKPPRPQAPTNPAPGNLASPATPCPAAQLRRRRETATQTTEPNNPHKTGDSTRTTRGQRTHSPGETSAAHGGCRHRHVPPPTRHPAVAPRPPPPPPMLKCAEGARQRRRQPNRTTPTRPGTRLGSPGADGPAVRVGPRPPMRDAATDTYPRQPGGQRRCRTHHPLPHAQMRRRRETKAALDQAAQPVTAPRSPSRPVARFGGPEPRTADRSAPSRQRSGNWARPARRSRQRDPPHRPGGRQRLRARHPLPRCSIAPEALDGSRARPSRAARRGPPVGFGR